MEEMGEGEQIRPWGGGVQQCVSGSPWKKTSEESNSKVNKTTEISVIFHTFLHCESFWDRARGSPTLSGKGLCIGLCSPTQRSGLPQLWECPTALL